MLDKISKCKTYKALLSVLVPMLKSGELKIAYIHNPDYICFYHGDNLLNIRSDISNYHANNVDYIIRSNYVNNPDSVIGGKFECLKTLTKQEPTKNQGILEFYEYMQNFKLGLIK